MNLVSKPSWRIFVGPVEICGIAESLASSLRRCDVDAQVWLSFSHRFNYETSCNSWINQIWSRVGRWRSGVATNSTVAKIFAITVHKCWSWVVLCKSIAYFNVFIFFCGQTITNTNFELFLLRCFRKKILFINVGSDSRPVYLDGIYHDKQRFSLGKLKTLSNKQKKRIKIQEKYANIIINSPLTSQFCAKNNINWFLIGIPRILQSINHDASCKRSNERIRILHCPSDPFFKGSDIIIGAVSRLQNKGYPIDLVIIKDMPNDVVLSELNYCDFVVDQIYSDTPLAIFAMEAAFFGKPAVVGGYGFNQLRVLMPDSMWPPSKTCLPCDIEQAIEDMIVNVEERQRLGVAAQKFVRERWNPVDVARRYLRLIENDIPTEWWFDPRDVLYLEGAGQSAACSRDKIRKLIDKYGVSALQLSHRPELEKAFLEFAGVEKVSDA